MSIFSNIDEFFLTFKNNCTVDQNGCNNHKIICFDYGTHKIGVAISDEQLYCAFPHNVLVGNWRNIENAYNFIQDVCLQQQIKYIVFGLPKTLNNEMHNNCVIIYKIAEILSKQGYNILLFDERFSTKAVYSVGKFEHQHSCNKHFKRKQIYKNKYDDAKAASIILNDVLAFYHNNKIDKL